MAWQLALMIGASTAVSYMGSLQQTKHLKAAAAWDKYHLDMRKMQDTIMANERARKILSENEIPFSNGLGSSAAALCTGLLIGNHLIGNKFSLEDLNEKAIKIEGHPDNVTPCLFGGLTISVFNDEKDKWIVRKIDVSSELNIMVFTPNFISNTNFWEFIYKSDTLRWTIFHFLFSIHFRLIHIASP